MADPLSTCEVHRPQEGGVSVQRYDFVQDQRRVQGRGEVLGFCAAFYVGGEFRQGGELGRASGKNDSWGCAGEGDGDW